MKTVTVRLDSIEKIKIFNRTVCKFDCDFDLELSIIVRDIRETTQRLRWMS